MAATAKPQPTIPTALDIAQSKGFLTPEAPVAPRVEDQPTTPTVPTVDPLAGILKREGLIRINFLSAKAR
jgi:hypothetical protein